MLLEVIATSSEDCATAEWAGADRIELCAALEVGGLTPSAGLLAMARTATRLPLMAMVRPRSGGFCYSPGEFAAMRRDAEHALAAGVDGLVFGFLHSGGAIDGARTAEFVRLAAGKETVFHRAFDVTPEPATALEQLIDAGVTRVLTSGQAATALHGAELIRRLLEQANGRIQILPGSGITPANVAELVLRTGAVQVHASCSGWAVDDSSQARPELHFGPGDGPIDRVRILDAARVAAIRNQFQLYGRRTES